MPCSLGRPRHAPPARGIYSSDEDDYEPDGEGDDCGSDYSNGYSLSLPAVLQPKSATTGNDKSQISEVRIAPKVINPKSFLVGILRDISSKLQGWTQPSQMLSPVSFDPPSDSPPPSPPLSPPTHYECPRCEIGVLVKDLCQGQFMYESLDSEWDEVCCYRCPTCNRDPLCPLRSPPPAPEPEPEPVPEPEPAVAPGGFMSADELEHDVFKRVPATSSVPPMIAQPDLVPKHWQSLADLEGRAQGWGCDRTLPVVHPGAIKLWMRDGSGGYQLIGYGGDRPYRWSSPGSHTPHAIL